MLEQWVDEELRRREESGLLRVRRCARAIDCTHVEIDGRRLVNFASNNYLGLTHHPRVVNAALEAIRNGGLGAGASPLICGYSEIHAAAERAIAIWKGAQRAILLPSGYQSAHAIIGAIAAVATLRQPGVRFLADKLCHASLLDAVATTGAEMRVFPHNGMDKLQRLLHRAPADQLQVVLTESIFSMDGDCADLAGLAELKREHAFFLLLDEAHGGGVYGPGGAGLAAEQGHSGIVDASIVTLSKAIGAAGGAVCASRQVCEAVVNWGRAYIYSTSVPPAIAAAAMAAIEVMRDEPRRQARVRELARRVRARLAERGFKLPPGDSPIIPVIFGSEEAAMRAAQKLDERGLLAVAIRPPTVPRGSSRLRVTLSCEHTAAEIDALLSALE